MISAWRGRVGVVAMLALVVVAAGFMAELLSGLPLSRESRSWPSWLAGVVVLGALYVLGEGAGQWIAERDDVADPLAKRLWHLALLGGVGLVFAVAAAAALRMVR